MESIGENLQPESDKLYAFQTDSFNLEASVFNKERTRIDLFANFMTGNYVDEVFGTVRCESVFQLSPSNTMSVPRSKTEYVTVPLAIDSIVLELAYQAEAYGRNVPMYFQLQELQDNIHIDSVYYSDFVVHKGTENLIEPGHEWQQPQPEYVLLTTAEDRLHLRLKLKNSFAERLLNDTPLTSFADFRDALHGLVLSSTTVDGRVISFAAADSKVIIYYNKLADPMQQNTHHGLTYELVYTSQCESFTRVNHQYYGTDLSPLSYGNEIDGTEYCFAQHAGATRIRVDISDVLRLQNDPEITINKAELVIPYDNESKYAPIDLMTLTYLVDEDTYRKTPDSAYIGGLVNKTAGSYRFNITRHVQGMLDGEITQGEIFLTDNPLTTTYNSMGVRRSLLHGPQFSTTDKNSNMRLLITYTH